MVASKRFRNAFALAASAAFLSVGFSACQWGADGLDGKQVPQDDHLGPNAAGKSVFSYAASVVPGQFADMQLASGLAEPVAMDFAPDGRLFICQKSGQLRIVKNGALLGTPFMSLSVDAYQERGLLGVAFDPNWATQKYVYVYYTPNSAPAHNRVSRFLANGDVVGGAEQVLIELENLTSGIHNGGAIHFGTDGKLYIAVGENSQPTMAQRQDIALGKMLRINADGSVPSDNPFVATQSRKQAQAIWGYGFRNPFTFAVQPGTGRIFVNDVGQDKWEEIDELQRGNNYGWATAEGNETLDPNFSYTPPWFQIGHVTEAGMPAKNCSIIGGTFYNPAVQNFPNSYVGSYFYGDYCAGWVKSINTSTKAVSGFATGIANLVDLKTGPDGALYYLTLSGMLNKITFTGSSAPSISVQPQGDTIAKGENKTFTVSTNGTGLTYQWQRNGANIGGNSASLTLTNVQITDNNAQYRVIVSNASGSVTSINAILIVINGSRPVASIATPTPSQLYTAGQNISFSGSATDADGPVATTGFTWDLVLYHDAHNHLPTTKANVTSGTFTIPNTGEVSPNVWYRITLTVRDASGLKHSVFRDIQPVKANLTLATSPAGLRVDLDANPYNAPATIQGVAGIVRPLTLISPQALNGSFYTFSSWSQGGAQSQNITFPSANATYTANFAQTTWLSQDVGATGIAGSFSGSGAGPYTVQGSGADIWGTADAFRYGYQSLSGDGMITARVSAVQNTDVWAKAGVMIRENTVAGSRHAFSALTSANGVSFQRREAANGTSLSNAIGGAAPYWVRLVRSGPSFKSYASSNGSSWTLLGESLQNGWPKDVLAGLAVTAHNNTLLNTSTFDNVSVVRHGWTSTSIGASGWSGSGTGYGTVQVSGGGNDIWGNADQFFYYSRQITGDGEIRARVASVQWTDNWAKAGVMIRETLTPGSRHAFSSVTPANGTEFLRRDATDGVSTPVAATGTAPRWLRISRIGNLFTSYQSADGATWTTIGSATITMGSVVNVGLAVCSHQGAIINNSVFDNIIVTD